MGSELYSRMQPFLGDEQKLCQRMAGQMDLWEECVGLFPREEIIQEMDAALQADDEKGLYASVHRLKGNLANFGFDFAAEKAMKVLAAIKENKKEQMKQAYAEFKEEYARIIERIGDVK